MHSQVAGRRARLATRLVDMRLLPRGTPVGYRDIAVSQPCLSRSSLLEMRRPQVDFPILAYKSVYFLHGNDLCTRLRQRKLPVFVSASTRCNATVNSVSSARACAPLLKTYSSEITCLSYTSVYVWCRNDLSTRRRKTNLPRACVSEHSLQHHGE